MAKIQKITPTDLKIIRWRYDAGETISAIASSYSCTHARIKRLLTKDGIVVKPEVERLLNSIDKDNFDTEILSQNLRFDT